MENNNKNPFETVAEMQKQAVEQMASVTEKMQKSFFNNGQVNFDSDVFRKWYDSQMAWFNNANGQATEGNKAFGFFNDWMNTQANMAKSWFENAQGAMPNMFAGMNSGNGANDPFNTMSLYKNWMDTMNSSFTEMQKNFSNGDAKNAFSGMLNNADMYMKAFEFWSPVLKSLQDKTFTPDSFKQMFNTGVYKEMMDKMFNIQPDFMKGMFENQINSMKENMGKTLDMNKNVYDNMKENMMKNMPDSNAFFGNMMEGYNKWYNAVADAAAPITRLMPQNAATKQAEAMHSILNEMMIFNMKNSQMKYIMYNTGLQAMEEVAETLYTRSRNGDETGDFTSLYTNWLNTNDKHFVKLFESEEYSKLMSEVSAMQLTLKKKFESQVENALSTLPLINRTEMDELYKTVQALKKRISTLEKQIDAEEVSEEKAKEHKAPKSKKA